MKKIRIGFLILSAFLLSTPYTYGAAETQPDLNSLQIIKNADGSITIPEESLKKLSDKFKSQENYINKLEWALFKAQETLEKMKGCRLT